MTSCADVYMKGIYDRFRYFATWLPNTPLALGDIGIRRGRNISRLTTLRDLGLAFQTRSGSCPIDFSYIYESRLERSATGQGATELGGAVTPPEGQITIQFNRSGSFLFEAKDCLVEEIENKYLLGQALIDRHRRGEWQAEWVVVDTVVRAATTTVLVANSQEASIELGGSVDLARLNLASAEARLHVRSKTGEITHILAERDLMPLFKVSRIRRTWLSKLLPSHKPTFGGKTSTQAAPGSDDLWERLEMEGS